MAIAPGTLYLCATPIGNLEDITYRAIRILKEVSLIAAEDTRHTRNLLNHFEIKTQLISYHEHNKNQRGPEIIGRLLAGDSIAVVSDAGLPGISDPGADIVKLALAEGITVSPVPGANAALSGLVCSGLDTRTFLFMGFLPKTAKKSKEQLLAVAELPYTLVFYESPHRLTDTLKSLSAILGDRQAAIGRELTKKFEEFIRGNLTTIEAHFRQTPPRGEFTIIVAGNSESSPGGKNPLPADPAAAVAEMISAGMSKKDAIKEAAIKLGLPKRTVYQAVLEGDEG